MANRIEGRENRMGGKKTRAAKAKLLFSSAPTPINGRGGVGGWRRGEEDQRRSVRNLLRLSFFLLPAATPRHGLLAGSQDRPMHSYGPSTK